MGPAVLRGWSQAEADELGQPERDILHTPTASVLQGTVETVKWKLAGKTMEDREVELGTGGFGAGGACPMVRSPLALLLQAYG